MNIKFSLVIPTFNGAALVKNCLKSYRQFEGNRRDVEVIVVDDGSTKPGEHEELAEIVAEFGDRLILCKENRGFPTAANVGISDASGQFVILVNNDIVFTQPILDLYAKRFESDARIGVIGARLYFPEGRVQHGGTDAYKPFRFIHVVDPSAAAQSRYCYMVTGALFGIRREALTKVGLLNSNYFISCDDSEYCLRTWLAGFRVFYDADIQAVHLEGATRGRDIPNQQKNRNPELVAKESKTGALYYAWTCTLHWSFFVDAVKSANQGTHDRLEVGSGFNGQPGYLHLDIRPGPGVDVVCDFSKDRLPFVDGCFKELLSNHSIEHVSFRKLTHVLSEWNRVLADGGKLLIRTPDLKFICETYLAGQTTPESPEDERYISENFGDVTPSWWANIKLFAGQDYPSNFHHFCWDFKTAVEVLTRFGFENIRRVQLDKTFSPGELQIEATKAPHKEKLLVRRTGALGDTILATPILRSLASKYQVYLESAASGAFDGLPYIRIPLEGEKFLNFVDLDLAYEKRPMIHPIAAYAQEIGLTPKVSEMKPDVFVSTRDRETAGNVLRGWKNTAVLHFATSWTNRTIHPKVIDEIVTALLDRDIMPIFVGSGKDQWHPRCVNMIQKLSIGTIAALIEESGLFIGSDSGIYHVASCTDAFQVGLFTCARAENRRPVHKASLNFEANVECVGCLHEAPAPVTFVACKFSSDDCVRAFDGTAIASEVFRAMHEARAKPAYGGKRDLAQSPLLLN